MALGFSSSSPRAFASLAFTVLPTVFVLGWFTIVRLTDTSVANIISLRRMELIRRYYAALAPMAPPYFGADESSTARHGPQYGRWSFLFTVASMVIRSAVWRPWPSGWGAPLHLPGNVGGVR